MCTATFFPQPGGYVLAMNRDEQRSRRSALPPDVHMRSGGNVLHPRELSGGTWIGTNAAGLSLALLNWYSQPSRSAALSRGIVIPSISSATSLSGTEKLLKALPLSRLNPFRLLVVEPAMERVAEFTWNGRKLGGRIHGWHLQHWFSSGFDEIEATRIRGLTCAEHACFENAGTVAWARALHRSHEPGKGPFSICVHREDACTVSFTEIDVRETSARMTYVAGPPCSHSAEFRRTLALQHPTSVR